MLNTIKELIKEKKAFQESTTNIITESDALDDSIILGQESKKCPQCGNDPCTCESNDIDKIDNPEDPVAGSEVTPEQPTAGTEDILTTEIDLATNTPTSTLPVPPSGAADAVADDDLLNTTIDDGFGDDITAPAATDTTGDGLPADGSETVPEPAVPEPAPVPVEEPADDDLLNAPIDGENNKKEKEEEDLLQAEIDDDETEPDGESAKNESGIDQKAEKIVKDAKYDLKAFETAIKDKLLTEMLNGKQLSEADIDKAIKDAHAEVYTEAISIGDEGSAEDKGGEDSGSEGGEENAVTSAINDKIEDTQEEEPVEDLSGAEEPQAVSAASGNEELMKKLSNLTKTIEDIKMNVYGNK